MFEAIFLNICWVEWVEVESVWAHCFFSGLTITDPQHSGVPGNPRNTPATTDEVTPGLLLLCLLYLLYLLRQLTEWHPGSCSCISCITCDNWRVSPGLRVYHLRVGGDLDFQVRRIERREMLTGTSHSFRACSCDIYQGGVSRRNHQPVILMSPSTSYLDVFTRNVLDLETSALKDPNTCANAFSSKASIWIFDDWCL